MKMYAFVCMLGRGIGWLQFVLIIIEISHCQEKYLKKESKTSDLSRHFLGVMCDQAIISFVYNRDLNNKVNAYAILR